MAVDLIDLHGKSSARLSKARPPNEAASHGAIDYFSTSTTKRVVVFCAPCRAQHALAFFKSPAWKAFDVIFK